MVWETTAIENAQVWIPLGGSLLADGSTKPDLGSLGSLAVHQK